jgi:hypothetical protein
MKGCDRLLKNEKYFDFRKMDKNKCPFLDIPKHSY